MRSSVSVVVFLLLGFTATEHVCVGQEVDSWRDLSELGLAVTTEDIEELFDVYATAPTAEDWFRLEGDTLIGRFSAEAFSGTRDSLKDWRITLPAPELATAEAPLVGWRIALDPGHLGGKWGPMESRSFRIGDGPVAQEGDLVLAASFHLRQLLEAMGAEVLLLRERIGPVTPLRPADFIAEAEKAGRTLTDGDVRRLFLREDIRERGRVLEAWGAHVVFALHVNASTWPDPENFGFVGENHGHVLVNGAYLDDELANEEQRTFLVRRWLSGYHEIEREIASAVADAMAEATGLEPFVYEGPNAVRVNDNPYVWGRNLMASRIFKAPVVYLEPWVLNSEEVYPWGSLGDYSGLKPVKGVERPSLPRAYAAFMADAMRAFAVKRAGAGGP